jgi:hypothetical protein
MSFEKEETLTMLGVTGKQMPPRPPQNAEGGTTIGGEDTD